MITFEKLTMSPYFITAGYLKLQSESVDERMMTEVNMMITDRATFKTRGFDGFNWLFGVTTSLHRTMLRKTGFLQLDTTNN